MSLRIIHVINNLSRGGAELLLLNTINLLPEHTHLIVLVEDRNSMAAEFDDKVSFACLHYSSLGKIFGAVRKLKAIIKNWKPDIIHSHLFNATLITRFAKPSRIPLVSTIHSTYSVDAFQKKKALLLERFTANKQDAIIAVSQVVLNDYLSCIRYKGRSFVLPNFLPNEFFVNSSKRSKNLVLRCVAVGNLKSAKNYLYILQAFAYLKDEEITLDIYGEGPLYQELEEYIKSKGLKVTLCGLSNNVLNDLPNYDLFIQASQHEGFGISVIEAMALKLPILLSDIKVFREITNGFGHFFTLAEPKILADGLIHLKNDEILRNQFVEHAYRYTIQNYTEELYKKRLTELYNPFSFLPRCISS